MGGLLITLEGIDGCGKTTQARLLGERLEREGRCVLLTRQPGGTPLGEELRQLVLAPEHEMGPEAELFLYLADRALHVADVVRPALEKGCVVISERYTDSTLAYQGYGRGLDVELLRRLNRMATGGLRPALTVVIDIPAQLVSRLDASRLDRLESAGNSFRARVAAGYRALAEAEPGRIKVVDGTRSIAEVRDEIAALVRAVLERGEATL